MLGLTVEMVAECSEPEGPDPAGVIGAANRPGLPGGWSVGGASCCGDSFPVSIGDEERAFWRGLTFGEGVCCERLLLLDILLKVSPDQQIANIYRRRATRGPLNGLA